MIQFFTGTPGSGKSLHSIRIICDYLKSGKNVISNFPIKIAQVKKNNGHYYYVPNEEITVQYLIQFARTMHQEAKQDQTLLIIDEASVKFNCRTFGNKDRLQFCSFFAQHRKYGYNIVLISQTLRQVDRQIRDLVELEIIHRKLNYYSIFSFLPFNLFTAIEVNKSVNDKNSSQFFRFNKYYGGLYDTFYEFDSSITDQYSEIVQDMIEKSEIKVRNCIEKPPKRPRLAGGKPEEGPPARRRRSGASLT